MKKFIKVFIIIVAILSVLVDSLWLLICFGMPDKTTLNTFNFSDLVNTEDQNGEKTPIIEVNYFPNMFELKFNYFTNIETVRTDNPDVYSVGVQIMNFESHLKYSHSSSLFSFTFTDYYKFKLGKEVYNYNSNNDFSFKAIDNITDKEGFLISVNTNSADKQEEVICLMSFNNSVSGKLDSKSFWFAKGVYIKDINYMIKKLYDSVSVMAPNTSGRIAFEFGDIFNYQLAKPEGGFYDIDAKENEKLENITTSYYNIKVTTHKDNATRAEQSLFGQIAYNSNYCDTSIGETADYFAGEVIYDLVVEDFEYISVYDNKFDLEIKESIYNYLRDKKIECLNIVIDKDKLNAMNIVFNGFKQDTKLKEFKTKIYTLETVENEIVKLEVEL